ncbi:MAG: thioredoxin, partial [Erysipelothrix sp.]|nr:thioredoxin [Erysipelothrix sp.]
MAINVTEKDFEQAISEGVVLVDFYADWCGPCKMVAPVLEEVEADYGDKLSVVKVDVDVEQSLAQRFGVQSIPTLIVFKDGKQVASTLG